MTSVSRGVVHCIFENFYVGSDWCHVHPVMYILSAWLLQSSDIAMKLWLGIRSRPQCLNWMHYFWLRFCEIDIERCIVSWQ